MLTCGSHWTSGLVFVGIYQAHVEIEGPNMSSLRMLLERISKGDEKAEEEFVRTYQPHLKRHVRTKLRLRRMRRVSDTSDICQVALASVLVRAALGAYDIDDSVRCVKCWPRLLITS